MIADQRVQLADFATAIKSSNAGASWLTFDIRFSDPGTFEWIVECGTLDNHLFARLYDVAADDVRVYPYEPARTIKITIPRGGVTGSVEETDFDGVQQFAPLLDVEVPPMPPDWDGAASP